MHAHSPGQIGPLIETSYSKLYASIVRSSIWQESSDIRIVWITLLALKNRFGQVSGSVVGLARMANVPVEVCEIALSKFQAPDKYSSSPEHEGRRIKEIEGGWMVLNHIKYRDAMSLDERREYKRQWDQINRKDRKNSKYRDLPPTLPPTKSDNPRHDPTHADTDTDADTNKREREVELPHNFPKSPDDAVKQCEGSLCVDCAFITKLYNSAMSKLGKDGNGQPILSFRHYVAKHWPGEISRREEKKLNGNGHVEISGADKIVFNKEYERILQAIKDLKAGYGDHQEMDQADRIKLKKLSDRRTELRTTLHIII